MDVRRNARLADERTLGTRRNREVGSGELEHAQRVGSGLLQCLVAGDGGDAQQFDFQAREGKQQRDRVVVTRVTVEQDLRRHKLRISSTSRAVGSEGWAPGLEAAIAPAAHARRSASSQR